MQETLMREYKASLEKDRAERLGYRHSKDGESRDRKQRRKDRKHRRERKRSEGKEKVMFYPIDRCIQCGYNIQTHVHSQWIHVDDCRGNRTEDRNEKIGTTR